MVLAGISKLLITKICIHVAVAVTVLYVQITHRPKQTDSYYTNDPHDTKRAGVTYTCGCSLPTNLQSVDEILVSSRSLNSCYEYSSLETVTVLMYSHSAAALVPDLQPKITDLASSGITYRNMTGYTASQQAHDLSGRIIEEPLSSEVLSLFLNGYRQPDRLPSVNSLQSSDFTAFPKSYVRLAFVINCNNCSTCSLKTVNDILENVTRDSNNKDDAWGTCFPWGSRDNCYPKPDNSYQAKCLLYPTEALPANFAIQRFLDELLNLIGITIDSSRLAKGGNGSTAVLQPSSMYLNISQVQNDTVQLGFVEVVKVSALWASLLTLFPTLDKCGTRDEDRLEVCNGTSVCNVFTYADSYDLKCLHMKEIGIPRCEELMEGSTFDNADSVWADTSLYPAQIDIIDNPRAFVSVECPPPKCAKVLPHYVIWNTSKAMENDALNRFLSTSILNGYWAQRSGVCTNTYEHVVRYNLSATPGATATGRQGATNDSNHAMFLQTMCIWSTRDGTYPTGNGTYCWLTGFYHYISDLPEEPWRPTTDLDDELFRVTGRRFVCYKVKDQDLGAWFINVVGILFGWTGTVELLWNGVVIRLITRLKARREAFRIARLKSALMRGL